MEELEESLKESQEGREKDEDDLCEMRLKNLSLSKEYAKSLEESYSIAHNSFEFFLEQVKYFYPTGPISRELVRSD